MSQIDDNFKYTDRRNGSDLYFSKGGVYTPNQLRDKDRDLALEDYFNTHPAFGITSRDQIVNPVELLSQMPYGNSVKERKRYAEDLAKLEELQKQQQASYDEWYNSPEQQNIRDRQAGLNPDIVGLSGSETEQTPVGGADPLANVPSNSERFSSFAAGIGSLVSGVAGMASLPSLFSTSKLVSAQAKAQELANLSTFEQMVGSEISSRLSDAITAALDSGADSYDIADFFGDDKNFDGVFDTYAPTDSSRYRSSFANVRNRLQKNLAEAYEQGRVTSQNRSSFSALAADPRNSSDFLIQVAATKPYMEAQLKLEKAIMNYQTILNDYNAEYQKGLNVNTAIDAANAQGDYNKQYFEELDGKKAAAYENLLKEVDSIGLELEKMIRDNYRTLYKGNENNLTGVSVAYLYRNAPSGWKDYFLANSVIVTEEASKTIDPTTGLFNSGNPLQDYILNPTGVGMPYLGSSGAAAFVPPGSVASAWKFK